jgi:RHS repeat-associated protein
MNPFPEFSVLTSFFAKRRRSKTRPPSSRSADRRKRFVPALELLEKRELLSTYDIVFNSNFTTKIAAGTSYSGPYAEFKDPDDSSGAGAYSVYINWYGTGTPSTNGFGSVQDDGNGWLGVYAPARTFTAGSHAPVAYIYDPTMTYPTSAEGESHLIINTFTNYPPVVTSPGNQTTAEGAQVSLQVNASDQDGDSQTFSASGLPQGLSINSSGFISGTVDYSAAETSGGSYNVTVTDTDAYGATGTASFVWTITDTNRPPVATSPGNQTTAEGASVSLQVHGSDPDGDAITNYSANGLPAGLSMSSSGLITGSLSYSAAETSNGTYTPTVTVTDVHGATGSASFTWTVTDTNRPPTINNNGDVTVNEGDTATNTGAFADPDTEQSVTLRASLGTVTGGGSNNGTWNWSYDATAPFNARTVTITADDGHGRTASTSFQVTVKNIAPSVTAASNQSATRGVSKSFALGSFSDPGQDGPWAVTVDWGDGTAATTLDMDSPGSLPSQAHTYESAPNNFTATVTVADKSGGSDSQHFQVRVASNISIHPAAGSDGGDSVTLDLSGDSNPDDSWTINWGDGSSQTVPGDTSSVDHTYDGSPEDSITATDHDSNGSVSAVSIVSTEEQVFSGLVATFSAGGSAASAASATIEWGDGSSTAGIINGSSISGSHKYAEEGSYSISVTVTDTKGNEASAASDALVEDAPLSVSLNAPSPVEGAAPQSEVVASFSDPDPNDNTNEYQATITWEDGDVTAGSISGGDGSFIVSGSHSYQEESPGVPFSVNVVADGGADAGSSALVPVEDAPLSLTLTPPNPLERTSLTDVPVASFTDADANADLSDYQATITWGEGASTPGTITESNGVFTVSGTYTYLEEAPSLTFSVQVQDAGGADAQQSASIAVADAALKLTLSPPSLAEGTPLNNVQVANFSDANLNAGVNDFQATIDWGDNVVSQGTISGQNGQFAIAGTHTYLEEGQRTITVTVNDVGGASDQQSGTYEVTDPALSGSAVPVYAVAGDSFSGTVANFKDGSSTETADHFDALVEWQDGTFSDGDVTGDASHGFTVSVSDHPFTRAGVEGFTVYITDTPNNVLSLDGIATITDATLTSTRSVITGGVEGVTPNQLSVTFSSGNHYAAGSDFQVTIDWGDNTTDVVPASGDGGNVDIYATHLYSVGGVYPVHVSLVDDNVGYYGHYYGGGTTDSTDLSAVVNDAPLAAQPGTNLELQEGQQSGDLVLATFTDTNPYLAAQKFTATVDWGERNGPEPASVTSPSAGQYEVVGNHKYDVAGAYSATVRITDMGTLGGVLPSVAVVQPCITVDDAPLTVSPTDLKAQEGSSFKDVVATFTDANPDATTQNFLASIDWGDDSHDTNVPAETNADGFAIAGTHTYAMAGTYSVTVTITDTNVIPGSATTSYSATSTAEVADALVSANGVNSLFVKAGDPFQGVVATFNDANRGAQKQDFKATIDWGDQSQSQGVVDVPPAGGFEVEGSHTYASPGGYVVNVTIADIAVQQGTQGRTAASQSPIDVMGITANDFGAIAGQPTGSLTIGNVADPADPYAVRDLRATISWGDGASTPASLQQNPDRTFDVIGAHLYAQAGDYPVQITATDGTGTVTASSTAAVQDWIERTQEPGYDPQRAEMATLGEATVVLNSGDLRLTHPLDFDQSPGTSVGGDPALVYNSETINVRPVVQIDLTGAQLAVTPNQIKAQLTWGDRSPEDWVTLPVNSLSAQGGYLISLPVKDPVTASGIYKWTVHLQLFDGSQPLDAYYHGTYQVVASDVTNSSTSDPYGAGWSIAGIDRLAVNDSGALYIYGSGGSRFFQDAGRGSYTSPPEDFGTLVKNGDNSFTYTAKDHTAYHFTSQGLLSSVVDRDGLTRSYSYDGEGRLTEVDAPDGSKTFFHYNGGQTLIQEPGNRTVELDLNGSDLAAIHDVDQAQSVRSFSYDSKDHVTEDKWAPLDATFQYNSTSGRVTEVNRGLGTSYSITTPTDPMTAALVALVVTPRTAKVVDGLGQSTQYTLDDRGRSVQIDGELGNTESLTRNTAGDVTQDLDPLKHLTSYDYNGGDLVGITYADGSSVSYAYDPTFHVMTQQIDERGDATNYTIDPANGDVLTITNALNQTTTQVWAAGLLQSVTDALGQTTQYQYDSQRRLQSSTDAMGGQTVYAYDDAGNVESVATGLAQDPTYAHSETTDYVYDGRNQLVQKTDAAGGVTQYQYNAYGELVSQIDPKANPTDAQGKTTLYSYDQRGFNTSSVEGAGTPVATETDLTYDAAGNLTERVSGISSNPAYQHVVTTDYGYDALNRQTDVFEGAGARQTHTVYDADGNVQSVTTGIDVNDPTLSHPSTTSYVYDPRNRPTDVYQAVGTPDETQSHTVYDPAGNVTSVTTGIGIGTPALSHPSTTAYVYDALNRQTEIDKAPGLPEEQVITQGYDAAGNLTSSTQSTGPQSADQGRQIITQYGFDALNRQTQIVEAYNSANTGWGEDDQRTTLRVYDAVGNVTSVTTGIMSANAMPLTTNYTYDPLNRVLTMVEAAGTSDQRQTTNVYDGAGNLVSKSQPGTLSDPVVVTAYSYDALNRQTQVTQAANVSGMSRTTETAYDASGNVVETTDPLGIVTAYQYDGFNERTAMTEAVGSSVQRTTHWSYDAAGNQISVVTPRHYDNEVGPWPVDDPATATTNYAYDSLNRVTDVYEAVGQPEARQTQTAYDAAGNVVSVTTGLASDPTYAHPATTNYQYDSLNRKIEEDDPANMTLTGLVSRIVVTHYDGFGNIDYQDVSDNSGIGGPGGGHDQTHYSYDALHRQRSVTLPPGDGFQVSNGVLTILPNLLTNQSTGTVYDSQNNAIAVTNAQSQTTATVYNAYHQAVQVTTPDGKTTKMVYDPAGHLVRVTDADSNDTAYHYDALGERDLVVDPLMNSTLSVYDADGRLQSVTDRDGRKRVFGYDELGHMTQQTWYAAPAAGASQGSVDNVLNYSYDAANNLRSASDLNPNAFQDGQDSSYTDSFAYNALNQVTSVQEPFGQSLGYRYDAAGNRVQVSDSQGGITNSTYDPLNELVSRTMVTPAGDAGTLQTGVSLSYDRYGHLVDLQRLDRSGDPSAPMVRVGSSSYTFDRDGRETGIANTDAQYVVQWRSTMGYDTLGRIKEQSEWINTSLDASVAPTVGNTYTSLQPFTYDPVGNLTADGNASYPVDAEGNPTGNGTVIGPGNRLKEDANYTYTYDNEGNLIRKTAKAGSSVGQIQWDYSYDEANRLLRATKTDLSQNQVVLQVDYSYDALGNRMERVTTSGGTQSFQRFAYDGSNVWADLNGSNVLQSRYLRGDAVDQLFARVDGGAQLYWDWTDRLGSIRAWTDSSGTPVAFLNYDSFGNPDARFFPASRSLDVGRYGFTGREHDADTGLQYNRARYYDPAMQRWISQDPLGIAAGDTNLYRYAGNNPVNAVDPRGTTTFGFSTVVGTIGGAAVGFAAGGLSGEDGWDWSRAWAGSGSGAMFGAGLGLIIDTWGASTPLSVALVGAGIGSGIGSAAGGGLLTSQSSVSWSGYAKGGAVGAISGFTGGYAGAVLAPVFGGGVLGGAATGFSGGVIGDIAGQGTALTVGWQEKYNPYQTAFAGAFGAVAGGLAGYLSKGLSGLRPTSGMGKGTVADLEVGNAGWQSRPLGTRVANVNGYYVKEVDPETSWLAQWWGRGAIDAQTVGLRRLGNMAPDFLYTGDRLISQDAGSYNPGNFWATWLKGSVRLGTPFNDIGPRNIGANGSIFDPTLPPVQELAYAAGSSLVATLGGTFVYELGRLLRR